MCEVFVFSKIGYEERVCKLQSDSTFCDRRDKIGLFLNGLNDKFSKKRCPKNGDFFGYFEKCPFVFKNSSDYFWTTFWKKLG